LALIGAGEWREKVLTGHTRGLGRSPDYPGKKGKEKELEKIHG